jgi:hypothetical protein
MTNLIGFLKKTLSIFSFFLLFFFIVNKVNANEFTIYSDFHHILDGNIVNSTIYLTITSSSSSAIKSYTVSIPDTQINPEVFLINKNTKLEPTIERSNTLTNITLDLQSTPVYPNKPITIKISYDTNINSNSLSLLSSVLDTKSRKFSFTYPTSLGEISWSSSPIINQSTKGDKTEITTALPITDKVSISIGNEIVYRYTVNKNLQNSSTKTILSEIKLPVNNNSQHITVENYTPKPDKTYKDIDGNYTLQYSVTPLSEIDVNIEGHILMNKSAYPQTINLDISSTKLWEITNTSLTKHINRYLKTHGLAVDETFSNINSLTEEKDLLYHKIYRYIIENLKPNTLTIGSLSGSERLGGQESLLKQDLCTSEDYADAIISLYRYYNIPARMVIGYVSKISNYHSDDMYHYWAEYFDKTKNTWISVDPFLEDYSNISLFNKDLKDHIALIYRYNNPNLPKLPYFSSQDFQIEIEEEEPKITHDIEVYFLLQPYKISNPYLSGAIYIKNIGNTILDEFTILESNPDLTKYIDYIENNTQVILLPNQSHTIKFNIPSEEVSENISASLGILSGTHKIENQYIEYDLKIMDDYMALDILAKASSILLFILLCISIYYLFKKNKKNE